MACKAIVQVLRGFKRGARCETVTGIWTGQSRRCQGGLKEGNLRGFQENSCQVEGIGKAQGDEQSLIKD
eukprot:1151401-Pelagomonas_calceolata.AAC.5